jgi:glycosyltransferase involved in cell wall biosynthesis
MRIAIVHDFLMQQGGAEGVLFSLRRAFPQAEVFTLMRQKRFDHAGDVHTSFLQWLPVPRALYTWLLPLMPSAVEHLDLRGFDLVISSCSSFAKGVLIDVGARHVCYCHTPPRFLWQGSHEYGAAQGYPLLARLFLPPLLSRLRLWDQLAATRVHTFIANSATVEQRIAHVYHAPCQVVHPPLARDDFAVSDTPKTFWLAGGRMVGYKRIDLAIEAANRLRAPLVVFGDGPLRTHLERLAGPTVRFVGRVSRQEQAKLLAECIAYLHPQEEDFGITALEAMASGRPVLAYGKGGATETVEHGKNGLLFPEQSWEGLVNAMLQAAKTPWDPRSIRASTERFSEERFVAEMRAAVGMLY